MDKKLQAILVCPQTKGPLDYRASRDELWSKEAGLAYAVRDGIPILIPSDARVLTEEEMLELESP